MDAELRGVFANSYSDMRLATFAFARNIACDLAGQYILAPVREFAGVDSAIVAALERLYVGLDLFLLEAEQAGALGQAYLVGVFPGPDGPEPMCFQPHQVREVRFDSIFDAARGDVSRASYVELLVPTQAPSDLSSSWTMGKLWYARVILTREHAYLEWPDGSQRGIFDNDRSNPLGRVPLVGTRRVKPAEDYTWLPTHAEDVRSCQIGVNLAMTDIENTARACSIPSIFASGANAKALSKGENRVGKIGILPPDVTLSTFALVPQIQPYIQSVETTIYYLQSFRKTRPEAFQGSIVTGAARRADAEGFVEGRQKEESRCQVLERDLLKLTVTVANTSPRAMRLELPELRVTYRYVRSSENALQEAQSMAVLTDLGLRDIVTEVAKAEGLSAAKAEQLIVDRLKRKRDLLGQVAHERGERVGMDKLDKAVPSLGEV